MSKSSSCPLAFGIREAALNLQTSSKWTWKSALDDLPIEHWVLATLPSGKPLHNHGKSPLLMGNPTINGPFSTATLVYQRVLNFEPATSGWT